jgi:hypothetical protein
LIAGSNFESTDRLTRTHTHKSLAIYHKHTQNYRAPTATTTNNTTNTNQRETMDHRVVLAAVHLRVTPATLGLLDVVNWADFTATDWQLNVLCSRMVTDLASYPESAQSEILATDWGNEMVMARVTAVPTAPVGLRVQEPSDDGVDDEDEDEDENEETVPVATGTTQEAARPTVPAPGGPIPTPDLLATTSIEQSITGSTVSRFPVDGAASDDDDDDDEGSDGEGNDGKGGEPTFEALHVLASDLLAVVVEEGSSSPRLMRMHW